MHKNMISSMVISLFIGILFIGCSESTSVKEEEKKIVQIDTKNVLKSVINVEGMTCEGCESAIQNNLSKMSGVVSIKASHTAQEVVIEYDAGLISLEKLQDEIKVTGYKIIEDKKDLKTEMPTAMKCGPGKCGMSK